MRKLAVFICLLAFCSCINELHLPFEPSSDELILNARFEIQDVNHSIYLSYKKGGEIVCPSNSTMSISINDADYQVISASSFSDSYIEYSFDYVFKQGDSIKIKASAEDKEVSSQTSFLKVDIPIEISGNDKNFRFSFKDNLDTEDYYRVVIYSTATLRESDTKTLEVLLEEDFSGNVLFESTNELIKARQEDVGNLFDISSLLSPSNNARVFSDETVSGQTINFDCEILADSWHKDINNDRRIDIVNRKLVVALQHLIREDYYYFSALNTGATFGYTGNIIVEPTIIPSNIQGGAGYVMAISSSFAYIDREDLLDYGRCYK